MCTYVPLKKQKTKRNLFTYWQYHVTFPNINVFHTCLTFNKFKPIKKNVKAIKKKSKEIMVHETHSLHTEEHPRGKLFGGLFYTDDI